MDGATRSAKFSVVRGSLTYCCKHLRATNLRPPPGRPRQKRRLTATATAPARWIAAAGPAPAEAAPDSYRNRARALDRRRRACPGGSSA
jgi:hypothetical protein